MLNDATWRKLPVGILTDENMEYVVSQMPDGLEYAPYMFYMAALKKADDDGIFDLEDGLIFSRLMRVPSEKIVFFVANLLGRRKIISRVSATSNKCLLNDWDYPKGTQPRTWAERRAIVQRMIAEEEAHPVINDDFSISDSENDSFYDDFGDKIAKNVTQTGYGDKNQKNVTQTGYGDKIAKNVTQKDDIEREREREIREIDKNTEKETHTHTEKRDRESVREEEREIAETSAGYLENPAPVSAERKEACARKNKTSERKAETKKESELKNDSTLSESIPDSKTDATEKINEDSEVVNFEVSAVLEAFFTANSFGFDVKKGKKNLFEITKRICELENESFKASRIVSVMVQEYKKMHDSEGVWKDIPITPTMMLNNKVWAYLLNITGKRLSKKKNLYLEQVEQYEQEALAEQGELVQLTRQQYLDHGIDPDDPMRFMLLLQAKKEGMPEALY